MKRLLAMIGCFLFTSSAHAAFSSWSVTSIDQDPFTNGVLISVDYTMTGRSAVQITCDSSKAGISIWIIPGYPISDQIREAKPNVSTAIDGQVLASVSGAMYVIGDNLAAIVVDLTVGQATEFLSAMSRSKRQIAFSDGISAGNHLLTNDGASLSANTLLGCVTLQMAGGKK